MDGQQNERLPSREKWWSELSVEEKVERTRRMLKEIIQQMQWMSETLNKLNNHVHSGNEMYFKEIRLGMVEGGRSRRDGPGNDDVFF